VAYLFDFIKLITWPNDASLKVLRIGVLESEAERSLSQEIRKQAKKSDKLRDKKVNVIPLKNLNRLPPLQILYINKNLHPNVNTDSLLTALHSKGTLLITEAGAFRRSMINFTVINDTTYYELNEQLVRKEGFIYKRSLALMAIKTQTDWESLFRKTIKALKEEQQVTVQQKQEITEKEETIEIQSVKITGQSVEITRQQGKISRQQAQLNTLASSIAEKQQEIQQQELQIAEKQQEIAEQSRLNTQYSEEIAGKQLQMEQLNKQLNQQLAKLKLQNVIIALAGLMILMLAGFGIYAYRNYKQKQKINWILGKQNKEITRKNEEISRKSEEISQQNEEIIQQNEEITQQRDHIAQQNKDITDSIIYARRIQRAILPKHKLLQDFLDMYIFYRPRDIVSGDFYWMTKKDDKLVIVAADCTGHGVPGAFMSILGVAFLTEIVSNDPNVYANEILNKLRESVVRSLNQTGTQTEEDETAQDGMDIALCVIDYPSMTLQYAGANNPLILIRDNELQEVKADRMPIAYSDRHGDRAFTNNLIPLHPGDCIYMFSDGYADQFGGDGEKRYSSKRLKNSLLEIHGLPLEQQKQSMADKYDQWKGKHEQIDDVLLIGIKI
jgi:serine phosphatase RsbU (regulator of sigma subunit)